MVKAGLTAEYCRDTTRLESWRIQDTVLRPGLYGESRRVARRIAVENARILRLVSFWQAIERVLARNSALSGGVLHIAPPDIDGRHRIDLRRVRALHESLRGKPVLHLDAPMRAGLIQTILPDIATESIDVASPHVHMRHVQGRFGKSVLCPVSGLALDEMRRWESRPRGYANYALASPTHLSEAGAGRDLPGDCGGLRGISNDEVTHFNAVAGLGCLPGCCHADLHWSPVAG